MARRRRATSPGARTQARRTCAQLVDARLLTGSSASGALPSAGITLAGGPDGLEVLAGDGARLRRWTWAEIVGWDADGTASDGQGAVRQLLTVRMRGGPLAVLADAGQVGGFLTAMGELRDAFGARSCRGARLGRHGGGVGRRIGAAVACMMLAGGVAAAIPGMLARPRSAAPPARQVAETVRPVEPVFGGHMVHLAKAAAAPAPAPASLATAPLASREAFGFLPYWALGDPASIDLSSLTTVAYFGVHVNANGTIDESPSSAGWAGYESQALAELVTRAHHDGERVVLSASCFDQAALDVLTHDPSAQATLASTLVTLVRAKNLDGVNLDLEGTGPTDRSGLDQLVARGSQALRAADPAWQLTVDTYASSAEDSGGFYDVAGMAPFVDAFVVMAYDMGGGFAVGPTGLPSEGLGLTDQQVVADYASVVGPSKVILGMPLYGEDWPTTGPTAGDPATGPPTPIADDQIAPTDTVYWDPSTGGPWAVYRTGRQWHQIWFDDPASLAAKADLARAAGLRGVALWALGMAVGTGDQAAAVTGVALVPQPPDGPVTPWRGPVPGWPGSLGAGAQPGAAPPGAARASSTGTFEGGDAARGAPSAPPPARGVFDGVDVSLVPWPGAFPLAVTAAGSLGTFDVSGAPFDCLASAPPLPVVQIDGTSAYLVRASTPADCANGTWAFVAPPGIPGSAGPPAGGAGKATATATATATGSGSGAGSATAGSSMTATGSPTASSSGSGTADAASLAG